MEGFWPGRAGEVPALQEGEVRGMTIERRRGKGRQEASAGRWEEACHTKARQAGRQHRGALTCCRVALRPRSR